MDRIVSVLLIGGDSSPDCGDRKTPLADRISCEPGSLDETRLRFSYARDREAAKAILGEGGIDAILLERCDADGLSWLHASAPDLPILMIAEDGSEDVLRHAIGEGAEDVLTPLDLSETSLVRRIDLAIARKAYERRQIGNARQDELTGLANGVLLEERFERALARADRFATLVGLVAIDIDGFDGLLAQHGQEAIDRLLPMAGKRFLNETRQTDTLARTREHGFTWLVEGLPALDDINALVNRLPQQLIRPFSIGDRDIRLTASAGLAICPYHGRDFHTVHGMAEAAMLDVSTISGDALLMHPVPPTRSAALT